MTSCEGNIVAKHISVSVLCHKHTLSHEQAASSHHDGERLVRESSVGGYVYVDKTAYLHSLVRQEGNMLVPPIGSKHGMSGPCHKMRYSFSSDTNNRNCIDVKWTPHLRSP